jgi:hypothetical protein
MAEAGHPTDEYPHISIHNSFRFPNMWILCQPGCHIYKQRAQQAEIRTSYGQLCRQRRVLLAPVAEVLVRPDRGALRMDDRVDLERKNEFTWNSHPSLFIFLFPLVPVIPLVLLRLNQDTLSVALVHFCSRSNCGISRFFPYLVCLRCGHGEAAFLLRLLFTF